MMEVKSVVYREWEDGFLVRPMTLSDARLAQTWYSKLCPTGRDLEMTLGLFPPDSHGFYIGEYKGKVVASAIRIPVADGVYYGSYYYVVPECRKLGFGKRIRDEVASVYVGDNILAIDAHDNLLEMNKRHGYMEAFRVTAFTGVPTLPSDATPTPDCSIKKVQEVEFHKIIAFDDMCFVRPKSEIRKKQLENLFAREGGESLVAVNPVGDVMGFGCRQLTSDRNSQIVGPLYAENAEVAQDLLRGLLSGIPGVNILISVCVPNKDAVDLVSKFGLKDDLHMIRMHLNGDPKELKNTVFGLTSIDVCGF